MIKNINTLCIVSVLSFFLYSHGMNSPMQEESVPRKSRKNILSQIAWRLQNIATSLNEIDGEDGNTRLHVACSNNDVPAAERLLKVGARSDIINYAGLMPLHCAAKAGHVSIVELLLNFGSNCEASSPHGDFLTALHIAAREARAETVKILLKRGADPNSENVYHVTPLMMAVTSGDPTIVRLLIEAFADPNARNVGEWTVLEVALEGGRRIYIGELLLDEGANPRDVLQWMTICPSLQRKECVDLLLTAGPIENEEFMSRLLGLYAGEPIVAAFLKKDFRKIAKYLRWLERKKRPSSCEDVHCKEVAKLFLIASAQGECSFLPALLHKVNNVDYVFARLLVVKALSRAVSRGDGVIVRTLLDIYAPYKRVGDELVLENQLYYAALNYHVDIVRQLLDAGAPFRKTYNYIRSTARKKSNNEQRERYYQSIAARYERIYDEIIIPHLNASPADNYIALLPRELVESYIIPMSLSFTSGVKILQ